MAMASGPDRSQYWTFHANPGGQQHGFPFHGMDVGWEDHGGWFGPAIDHVEISARRQLISSQEYRYEPYQEDPRFPLAKPPET